MRLTRDSPDILHNERTINRAAHAVLQALGFPGLDEHSGKKVFKVTGQQLQKNKIM